MIEAEAVEQGDLFVALADSVELVSARPSKAKINIYRQPHYCPDCKRMEYLILAGTEGKGEDQIQIWNYQDCGREACREQTWGYVPDIPMDRMFSKEK